VGRQRFKSNLERALSALFSRSANVDRSPCRRRCPGWCRRCGRASSTRRSGLRTGRPGPEFRPLAGQFPPVSLVVDLPEQELQVGRRYLGALGRRFSNRLLQRAPYQPAGPGRRGKASGGSARGATGPPGGHLDGSACCCPACCAACPGRRPVVLLPNRDCLLVVGSEDPPKPALGPGGRAGIPRRGSPSLNACPLRFRSYQWEPFLTRAEHPIRPLLGGCTSAGSRTSTPTRRSCWTAGTAPWPGHHRGPVPAGTGPLRPDRELHRVVPGHGRSLAARGGPALPGPGAGPGLGALGGRAAGPGRLLEPVGLFPERTASRNSWPALLA